MTLTELQLKINYHRNINLRNRAFCKWLYTLGFETRLHVGRLYQDRLSQQDKIVFRHAVMDRLKRIYDSPTQKLQNIDIGFIQPIIAEMIGDLINTKLILEPDNDQQQLKHSGIGVGIGKRAGGVKKPIRMPR